MAALDWYSDPDLVLRELRGERSERTRRPEIPGYADLAELSRGGQGVVYLARQTSTGRRVAVKVLLEGVYASRVSQQRFEREIELVASLRHPHIVRVYDSGNTPDGRLYFVMEHIEGVPLDNWTPTDPKFKVPEALRLFAEICEAINFAHQRGVIHRDLKSSNILIDAEGHPHVLDFGLAKTEASATGEDGGPVVSKTGQFMGSLPWASPEQVQGRNSQVDIRSDVYSLGVMLYGTLTGRFPYDVEGSIAELIHNILESPTPRPSLRCREVDDEVDTLVLKCLAKEPERRYQSAGEVARDIRRYLAGEPIDAKRDSSWYMLRKTVRRYRLAVTVVGVLVVLGVAFAATVTILYRQANVARGTAEHEAQKAKQVQQFLQGILATVDPYWAQGRDVGVLRELLDEAARRIGKSADTSPEVEAALHTTLGQTYMGLGLWDESEPHLKAALDLTRRVLGEDHVNTFAARVDWTTWLVDRPTTEGAEPFIVESLESAREVLGPEHRITLNLSLNWGYFLHGLGRLTDAEAAYRPTLETLRRVDGPEGESTVRAMNSLASLLQDMGRWEEALELIRDVVDIHRRTRGPEHPDTLLALNNHASALDTLGRHVEAESIQRQVLILDVKVLGERHPRTLVAMGNLSGMLQYLGRLTEAEELCRRALDLRREIFGEESEYSIISLNNLARILQDGGRWIEAEPLMKKVVELSARVFGPEHMRTLTAQNTLAANLEMLGHVEEAEVLLRTTLEAQQRTLGPAHPGTLTTMNSLAALLRDRSRTDEAELLYREIVELADASLPENHWYHYIFQGGLGRTLALAGRYAEAERELLESHAGLEAALGRAHKRTETVGGYLFELYEAWEKPEQSGAFQSGCVESDTGVASRSD